jgi:hypothetical protein
MASESIGSLYSTKIPSYTNTADIQAALRLYHYGSESYDTSNTNPLQLVNPSIAYTLNDLQEQIDGLDPTGSVSKSTIDAKGDLIVGLSNDNPSKLSVGSDNFVLTADNTQTLGVKWAAPSVGPSNSVSLTNKTISIENNTLSGVAHEILVLAGAL